MKYDVFVSYKAEEIDIAMSVVKLLEKRGVKCWIAPRDIPVSLSYAKIAPRMAGSTDAFILILTKASQDSPHVTAEVNRAFGEKHAIFPYQIGDFELTEEMAYFLSFSQITKKKKELIEGIVNFLGIKDCDNGDGNNDDIGDSDEDGFNACGEDAYNDKDRILSEIIYEECAAIEPVHDFSVGKDIPDDKLCMAVKEWGIDEEEPVFALFDATLTGGCFGLDGFAITLKGVYIKEDGATPHYFAWEDIDEDEIECSGNVIKLSGYELTTGEDEESNSKMAVAIYKCATRISEVNA